MKKTITNLNLFLCFAVTIFNANGQSLEINWAKAAGYIPDQFSGGSSYSLYTSYAVGDVAIDENNNTYYFGTIKVGDTIGGEFIGNGLVADVTDFTAFLTKVDSQGNYIWTKEIYSAGSQGYANPIHSNKIVIDKNGDLILTGSFGSGTLSIGNNVNTIGTGIFISKFDTLGNLIWVKNGWSDAGSHSRAFDLQISSTNDYFLMATVPCTGLTYQSNQIIATCGPNGPVSSPEDYYPEVFIIKINDQGNYISHFSLGNYLNTPYDEQNYQFCLDQNDNIYYLRGATNTTLYKFDSMGQNGQAFSFLGYDPFYIQGLAIDGNNEVYLRGGSVSQISNHIKKIDTNGNSIWDKTPNSGGVDIMSIEGKKNGGVYVGGKFNGTTVLDNITIEAYSSLVPNSEAAVIASLSSSGQYEWALNTSLGGNGHNSIVAISENDNHKVACGLYLYSHYTEVYGSDTVLFETTSQAGIPGYKFSHGFFNFTVSNSESTVNVFENTYKNILRIHPNPSSGQFCIQTSNEEPIQSIRITNSIGQVVMQLNNLKQSTVKIDLKENPGVYFVEVTSNGEKNTSRIILN